MKLLLIIFVLKLISAGVHFFIWFVYSLALFIYSTAVLVLMFYIVGP